MTKKNTASAWQKALELADQTPASRKRAVDVLRALSILVVVFGHWLMASPWSDAESDHMDHILAWAPWSHWLTWGLQVMPIFFFVGGYSNGITWDAAKRDGLGYGNWLHARLRRLLSPVLALLVFWTILGAASHFAGVPQIYLQIGSQVALIPVWFLAVYAMLVMLAPLMREAWRRWGIATLIIPMALAVAGDLLYFWSPWPGLGWANYLCLWLSVHQLGFLWLDQRLRAKFWPALFFAGGYVALFLLTELGPWPRSLVGVPGEEISNSTPPHLPLLALALGQFGFVLALEKALERVLQRRALWAAVVLLGSMIMTVFLWHSTAMMLMTGIAMYFDGIGLHLRPGEAGYWPLHLAWIVVFLIAVIPFVLLFSRFERPRPHQGPPPSAGRQILGALLMASGLALLALDGIDSDNALGIRWPVLLLPVAGAWLLQLWHWPRRSAVRS